MSDYLRKMREKQAAQGPVPVPEPKQKPLKRPPAGKPKARPAGPAKRPFKLTPAGQDERLFKKGRLPHRSEFLAVWDDVRGLWVIVLRVPIGDPDGGTYVNFTLECDGLFKGLHQTDNQYRDYAKKPQEKAS